LADLKRSDGHTTEAPVEFFEKRTKKNANMGETSHLYPGKTVTSLNWEVSLR
jgi:hypothetical protein